MKQIQRILSLLLAVCVLLSLAACGKDEGKPSEATAEISTASEAIPGEMPAEAEQAQEAQNTEAAEEAPASETEAAAEPSPEETSPVEEEDGGAVVVVPEDMGVDDL